METLRPEDGRMVTIDLLKANIFACFILLGATIVGFTLFFLIWPGQWTWATLHPFGSLRGIMAVVLALVAGTALHEVIHGITWSFFAQKGWKSISFGVIWAMLTPYCHCDEPMRIRPYQTACLMPLIIVGILPTVIAIAIGNFPLLLFGLYFIAGAAGDIWMAWLLTKESPDSLVLDHPTTAGYYIFDQEPTQSSE